MVGKDEEIWVPDGHDFATGFQVTKNGAKGYKHVHFNVNAKSGKTDKVVLSTSCRPRHNINLQLMMRERRGMGLQLAAEFRFYAKDWCPVNIAKRYFTVFSDSSLDSIYLYLFPNKKQDGSHEPECCHVKRFGGVYT